MDMIRKSETEIESFLRKTKSTLNARMRCNELCEFLKLIYCIKLDILITL